MCLSFLEEIPPYQLSYLAPGMRVRFFFRFLFLEFFPFFSFRAVDDRCCLHGSGWPGGVPVGGIRVVGGPPAALHLVDGASTKWDNIRDQDGKARRSAPPV